MSELVFPILGTALVFLLVLPACALVARGALWLLERDALLGPLHGLNARYLVILASSLLPLSWFVSAAVHQAETGRSTLSCLFEHGEDTCFEPLLFIATLGSVVLGCCVRAFGHGPRLQRSRSAGARALVARCEALAATHPQLAPLAGRFDASEQAQITLATHGLLRPRVLIGTGFAATLGDDALTSAPRPRARARARLRPAALSGAAAGRRREPVRARAGSSRMQRRWLGAREAHCDCEAVMHGGGPLALAEAIVCAARPLPMRGAGLQAHDAASLRLRVQLLLAFAEQPPVHCCRHGASAFPAGAMLLALVLMLPHRTSTLVLDLVHVSAEHALHYFLP